ncbi:MAG: group 1 glycosyl transferase [Gammaproteobacteria bacterium CG11_big_fil_rev_8_21_14_0_20_46_22]|nr:MAG: group 1 glycosyl transferase [Gammaproteobacteria bacterium CG12_big_fil_rev_8_21_14_0_65_46_12]PIR10341.1 MAG: group 1 glycosyl transferase [Gammaproteobacteria bacterium CG11_big_fil_rev_8_21_14_0_20_46_22]
MKLFASHLGQSIPSSRHRILQYIPYLDRQGISVLLSKGLLDAYPPSSKLLQPVWGGAKLLEGLANIPLSYTCDVSFVQRHFISKFSTVEPWFKKPMILDVDDAIWLNGEASVQKNAALASTVICGNSFLAEYFSKINPRIEILPTAIDMDFYQANSVEPPTGKSDKFVVGWSGSSGGFKYLYEIEGALKKLLEHDRRIHFHVMSDKAPEFKSLNSDRVVFQKWSPAGEAAFIQGFSVGIMPLIDGLWERGKCSYKMLSYMASRLPVVVSPVGMNAEVLSLAECGFSAANEDEWVSTLIALFDDASLGSKLGQNGYQLISERFSLEVLSQKMAKILRSVL